MKVLVFDCRKVLEINCRKMYVFACFLHVPAAGEILLGKVKGKNQKFREKQKWEETQIKRVSIRGYNPPAPERISELMLDLYNYFLSIWDIIAFNYLRHYHF